jgi:hypothetical protein
LNSCIDAPPFSLQRQYVAVRDVLEETRELLLGRVDSLPVAWAEARGWGPYLLGLSDEAMDAADTLGIARWFLTDPDCPPSLRGLAHRVENLCLLPRWDLQEDCAEKWPFTSARKRRQIAAVLQLLRTFYPRISELVDVGAGRGQLTTRAARALEVSALGLERDRERVAVASLLAGDANVEFVTTDVLAAAGSAGETSPLERLPRLPDRLLMALHGCGELGDAVVRSAVALSAHVLLLGCCPQKIRAHERASLVEKSPAWPKEVLGLANVLPRTAGVEGSLAKTLATKEDRLALRHLFEGRGIAVPPGEEMRGVNRRKVHAGLSALARAACTARALSLPTTSELRAAAGLAHEQHGPLRRLALPRSMLGRLLEIFLALDRAVFLASAGYDVRVAELFPVEISPRNIVVAGRAK